MTNGTKAWMTGSIGIVILAVYLSSWLPIAIFLLVVAFLYLLAIAKSGG